MTDKNGEELQVGDFIFFGEKARNQGSRGVSKCTRIVEIDRYIHAEGSWSGLTENSVIKCTEKFAEMFNNGSIFKI